MIEVLMQVRKDNYKDNPVVPEGLDLVEEDEQTTWRMRRSMRLSERRFLEIQRSLARRRKTPVTRGGPRAFCAPLLCLFFLALKIISRVS